MNLVPKGRLNFRPVQIRFETRVLCSVLLSSNHYSSDCCTFLVIPSEADLSRPAVEGSAVPRTSSGNAEYYAQTELSSRLSRHAVEPERRDLRFLLASPDSKAPLIADRKDLQ